MDRLVRNMGENINDRYDIDAEGQLCSASSEIAAKLG